MAKKKFDVGNAFGLTPKKSVEPPVVSESEPTEKAKSPPTQSKETDPPDTKRKVGRPQMPKETKRIPYTTSIRPSFRRKIKMEAARTDSHPAAVLDKILAAYFSK